MNEVQCGFSIITPVYNREDCISRCIESVAAQDYPLIEHWIVDDGSTDRTSDIIEEKARKYPHIRYHRFEENKGVNAARNYAIRESRNKFISFLDSDDIFLPNALTQIEAHITQNYPTYQHFLFVQDDRVAYLQSLSLLNKKKIVELSFYDFLQGKISGDFLHVIGNDLLCKYPFNESLRIYEGITFLQIMREERQLLFINETHVQRDRDREDSVTEEYSLINKDAIYKRCIADRLKIEMFCSDYISLEGGHVLLKKHLHQASLLALALEQYQDVDNYMRIASLYNIHFPFFVFILRKLHLGKLIRACVLTRARMKFFLRHSKKFKLR